MHRFFAEGVTSPDDKVCLSAEDAQHALRVLRLRAGDPVEILSDGKRYAGRLAGGTGDSVWVQLLSVLPSTEPSLKITLYQGMPKADKMELIIQKAVELGAARIVPVGMSRCVAKPDPRDGKKKKERWQKIAREACKQSGRCMEPEVAAPMSMPDMLDELPHYDAALVPWEEERTLTLSRFYQVHQDAHTLAVIIGPEGGIDASEISCIRQAGALPVTLGPRILRTETAGICTISALMCLYGEME